MSVLSPQGTPAQIHKGIPLSRQRQRMEHNWIPAPPIPSIRRPYATNTYAMHQEVLYRQNKRQPPTVSTQGYLGLEATRPTISVTLGKPRTFLS